MVLLSLHVFLFFLNAFNAMLEDRKISKWLWGIASVLWGLAAVADVIKLL